MKQCHVHPTTGVQYKAAPILDPFLRLKQEFSQTLHLAKAGFWSLQSYCSEGSWRWLSHQSLFRPLHSVISASLWWCQRGPKNHCLTVTNFGLPAVQSPHFTQYSPIRSRVFMRVDTDSKVRPKAIIGEFVVGRSPSRSGEPKSLSYVHAS